VGAEWVFRLWVDPVGKWRRYLLGNPLFVWNALCWWLHRSTRRTGILVAPASRRCGKRGRHQEYVK
jgi:hypothetical protein